MKKLLLLFLGVLISTSLVLTGCGNSDESTESTQMPVQTETPTEENIEDTLEETEVPANPADFSDVLKIVDTLLLSSVETGSAYNAEDPSYVWKSLIYGTGIYYTGNEIIDDSLVVPSAYVLEYASSMFSGCTQLPKIPEDIDVTYDEAKDAYLFPLGDRGASYSEILSVTQSEGETILLEAALFSAADDEKTVIASAVFTLTPNPDAEAVLFPYSVVSMELAE